MTHFLILRPTRVLAWVAAWTLSAVAAVGQSVTVTNYTAPGYIFDSKSDAIAAVAGFDRIAFSSEAWTLRFRLLDPDGQPVNLRDASGDPVSEIIANYTVLPGVSSHNVPAGLQPHDALKGGVPYRVSVYFDNLITNVTDKSAYTFVHFQDDGAPADQRHVVAVAGAPAIVAPAAIFDGIDGRDGLLVNVPYTLYRSDDDGLAEAIPLIFSAAFIDDLGNATSPVNFLIETNSPVIAAGPVIQTITTNVQFRLRPAAQLDPVNRTYRVRIGITHEDNPTPPSFRVGNTTTSAPQRIAHFNGALRFGSGDRAVATTLTSINGSPGLAPDASGITASLEVPAGGLTINQRSDLAFQGETLFVRLIADGSAYSLFVGTPITLSSPANDLITIGGLPVILPFNAISLTTNGASASGMQVRLPPGAGYRNDTAGRLLNAVLPSTGPVELNSDLEPVADVALTVSGQLSVDTAPLWFGFNSATWRVDQGAIELNVTGVEYHRKAALNKLAAAITAGVISNPDAAIIRDNTGYYNAASAMTFGNLTLGVDDSGQARISGTLTGGAGEFLPHFPYAVEPSTDRIKFGSLQIKWTDSVPVSGQSHLLNVDNFAVAYLRGCGPGDAPCPPGSAEDYGRFIFDVDDGGLLELSVLRITRDGGLANDGAIVPPGGGQPNDPLMWGRIPGSVPTAYAHELAAPFARASYHMPGHMLVGGIVGLVGEGDVDLASLRHPAQAISVTLFSGALPDAVTGVQGALLERPGILTNDAPYSHGYALGLGQYPGLNFLVADEVQPVSAQAYLGDALSDPFELHTASKYYIRRGGLSGRHQAANFKQGAKVYGYDMAFSRYALGFLGNANLLSETEGSINIPAPTDMVFDFEAMRFTCTGGIDDAQVAKGQVGQKRTLGPNYWRADVYPQSYIFAADDPCLDKPRFGIYTHGFSSLAPGVRLQGAIGFDPNGQLLRPSQPDTPKALAGRLTTPDALPLPGAENEPYALLPSFSAYFNHQADHPVANGGFLVLNGLLDVAFFEDIAVTIHSKAREVAEADTSLYAMMRPDYTRAEAYKEVPNDLAHRGFPTAAGITVDRYRDSSTGEDANSNWKVRGARGWLGKSGFFDFTFEWDPEDRSFSGVEKAVNLIALETKTRATYLSAKRAEIEFGAKYGVPKLNTASFASKSIKKGVGMALRVVDTFGAEAQAKLQGFVDDRTSWMNRSLADMVENTVREVLDDVLDPIVSELRTVGQTVANGWREEILPAYSTTITVRVKTDMASNIVTRLDALASNAVEAIQIYDAMLTSTGTASLANNILINYSPVPIPAGGPFVPADFDLVNYPNLPGLRQSSEDIKTELQVMRAALTNELLGEVQQLLNDLDLEEGIQEQLEIRFSPLVVEIPGDDTLLDLANYLDDELKKIIINEVRDQILQLDVMRQVKAAIDGQIAAVFDQIDNMVDELAAHYTKLLTKYIEKQLAPLDKKVNAALGPLRDFVGTGEITGHARVVGDSLRELRVDGKFQWKVPDAMEFKGFLVIREMHSAMDGGACVPDGRLAYEMIFGAKEAKMDWLAPDMKVTVELRTILEMAEEGGDLEIKGIGGGFKTDSKIKLEGFEVTRIAAYMGVSPDYGCHIAAALNMKFGSYAVGGGVFFGSTCSIEPLKMIDPDVAGVLGAPPFTGVYLYGEGRAPILDFGCPLRVTVGVGAGFFYFVEGHTMGFKALGEVSGEAICLVTVKGQLKVIGLYQASTGGKVLDGTLALSGKAGKCPFCVKLSRTYGIRYQNNKFSRK